MMVMHLGKGQMKDTFNQFFYFRSFYCFSYSNIAM